MFRIIYIGINSYKNTFLITYTKNDKINIVVRPENIKLTKVKRNYNCLKGIITNMVYDGYITKVFVKVDNRWVLNKDWKSKQVFYIIEQ